MKRFHIELKADTLEKLMKIKTLEQEKQFYNVTNDIIIRILIEIENEKLYFNLKAFKTFDKISTSQRYFICFAWQLWKGDNIRPDIYIRLDFDCDWDLLLSVVNMINYLDENNRKIFLQAIELYTDFY